MKPTLTEEQQEYLARWLHATGKSLESVLGDLPCPEKQEASFLIPPNAIAILSKGMHTSRAKTVAAKRQEEARQLRDRLEATRQSGARQRQFDRTLRQLTAAAVALGRR